ncbi:MAG: SGNH/GDSL hydrolase family protein, partial [Deltaproteobacteria bacterium]
KKGKKGKKGHDNDRELLLVSLGASISFGYTLDPGLLGLPNEPILADNHHIPRLADLLEDVFGIEVDEYNLSVPGATSGEIAADQLPDALEEIARYEHGAVITVEAGGNDLRAFQAQYLPYCTSTDPADLGVCFYQLNVTLTGVEDNLRTILGSLREVAPDAPILVQTQYNPLYGQLPDGTPCAPASLAAFADAVLEGDPATNGAPVLGMNPRIRQIAAEYGAEVADVAGLLYTTGQYDNPIYYSSDCTHPAGTRDAVAYLGLPEDEVGAGFEAHFGAFAFALAKALLP